MPNSLCILPWMSLEATPTGNFRPCCLAEDLIVDKDGTAYDIANSGTLEQAFNSEYMENLREQFLNGKKPTTCKKCWALEASGGESKRLISNKKFGQNIDNKKLSFLDLKLGNICNLKCRICGSWSSSKWAQEEIDYELAKGKDNPLARKQLKEGGWPKRNPQFFEELQDDLKHVEYFEFTGGEPFMIKDHFKILMHCVEKGYAKNIDIHYNTNGTHLPPQEIFDLWNYFKHVEVAFSIDDIGEAFEYQRHPANWRQVSSNLVKFKEMKTANMDFQICSTVSIFNVFNWAKISLWVAQFQPKFFYVNTLFDPDYFNIQTLPKNVKDIVNFLRGRPPCSPKFIGTCLSTPGFKVLIFRWYLQVMATTSIHTILFYLLLTIQMLSV